MGGKWGNKYDTVCLIMNQRPVTDLFLFLCPESDFLFHTLAFWPVYRGRLTNILFVHSGYLASVQRKVNRYVIVHSGFLTCVQRKVNRQIICTLWLSSQCTEEG